MEFWPSYSLSAKKEPQKTYKGKSRSKEALSNYPIIDYGVQSAGTLVKVGEDLEWRTVHSARKGLLTACGNPSKVYPCTKPKDITNDHISLRQRTEQGMKFMRTYHPDIDIPSEQVEEQLDYDDKFKKQRAIFDPFSGNVLAATCCFDGIRKKAVALAFPTGPLGRDLNISPINLRLDSVVFQPRTQPLWTFATPIRQIISSAPAVAYLTEKKGYNLAVRSYGQIYVFDIRNQITSVAEPTKSPFVVSELMSISSDDYASHVDGKIVDMSFSSLDAPTLYLVTEQGAGYQCSRKNQKKIMTKIFDKSEVEESSFWTIIGDQTEYGGTVASEHTVRKFDTRTRSMSMDLLTYNDGRNVITSVCPSQIVHLLCLSTTSQVVWMDERFSKRPLLGWKHHRAFDRSLTVQTTEYGATSLALLGSFNNDLVSAISVGRSQDGPWQCQMSSRAVSPPVSGDSSVTGRTLVRHPGISSCSFSLLELSDQGSLHHQELHYDEMDTSAVLSEQPNAVGRFSYQWTDEVHELERLSRDLQPYYGNLASRDQLIVDVTELYEALFGEEAQDSRTMEEEARAEEVYETLERMPQFWQRSDIGEEHIRTLFDVAFGSGEEPLHEARADFLTGTVLDSPRGYRAGRQGRLPVADVAKRAGWHMNIQTILNKIAPDAFKEAPTDAAEELDLYHVSREEENPEARRREPEAREQLALDLALSTDVFSLAPIRNPCLCSQPSAAEAGEVNADSQGDTVLLTQAAEELSLTGKEPPQVSFGFLRPVNKEGKKHHKDDDGQNETHDEESEEGETTNMPLGVRLLLSEWNVGDDPYAYEYVDPYDMDGEDSESKLPQSRKRGQTRAERHRRGSSEDEDDGATRPGQSQAPPTIVAAKTLASTQSKPPTIGKVNLPAQTQVQTQHQQGASQTETGRPRTQQPLMMASTQIVPGPFGGRPTGVKKQQPAKKRMGGF